MKVNEIVREEKLDEALPLIAGIGAIPMIFSMVSAGLKAWSIYELYDVLSRNGYDIDNMSSEDKLTLFFTLISLFVPGGGKFTNSLLMKIMPDWVKRRGIKLVGDHLLTKAQALRKLKNANRAKYANKPGTSAKQAAKNNRALAKDNKRLTAQYQAVGKQLAAEKLKDQAFTLVGGLAILPLAYTYYGKLDELDKQYAAHKSGDTSTELFNSMDQNTAYQEYSKLRNKYIGELAIGVSAALSRTPVAKLASSFTKLVGKTPLVGGIVKLTGAVAGRVAKVGGPALAVLMQTDEGQKFLSNSIVEIITRGVGAVTSATTNLLAAALDKVAGSIGADTDFYKKVKPHDAPAGVSVVPTNFDRSEIYTDPKNPNIMFIRGVQVTTPDGYLKNNIPTILAGIENDAKLANKPNPLNRIPKNPNLNYKTY